MANWRNPQLNNHQTCRQPFQACRGLRRPLPASLFVARARKGQEKSSALPAVGVKGYTAICDASNETELFMSANRVSSSKVPRSPFRRGTRKRLKKPKRGRSVYEAASGKEISFKEWKLRKNIHINIASSRFSTADQRASDFSRPRPC